MRDKDVAVYLERLRQVALLISPPLTLSNVGRDPRFPAVEVFAVLVLAPALFLTCLCRGGDGLNLFGCGIVLCRCRCLCEVTCGQLDLPRLFP